MRFFVSSAISRGAGVMDRKCNETMGQRIKARRIEMGMTQEYLAELMCIPKSTISAYENDKVDIKSSVIRELAGLLNTTANYLLDTDPDEDTEELIGLFSMIKNETVRKMILVQIRALAEY